MYALAPLTEASHGTPGDISLARNSYMVWFQMHWAMGSLAGSHFSEQPSSWEKAPMCVGHSISATAGLGVEGNELGRGGEGEGEEREGGMGGGFSCPC